MGAVRYPKLHKTSVFRLGEDTRFVILPVGLYCNSGIDKANAGERVSFTEPGRVSTFVVKRRCRLPVSSSLFSFMCHSIYGHASFERLSVEWSALCVNEGLGRRAFSEREVLLLELGEWNKELYLAEEERKRKIAEALARQEEMKRLEAERELERQRFIESIPRQIESGEFTHPDIRN